MFLILGSFAVLQAMQERIVTRNKMELINAVNIEFDNYPHKKLNNIFLTLQTVMQSIILHYGGNEFDILRRS